MPSRREFCHTITAASAIVFLGCSSVTGAAADRVAKPGSEPYVDSQSLLQRQQAFLDLRFGMFLHFNMATYQNREWGDSPEPVRMHSIPRTEARKVRVLLWAQAPALCISEIGVYDEPARKVIAL